MRLVTYLFLKDTNITNQAVSKYIYFIVKNGQNHNKMWDEPCKFIFCCVYSFIIF
jgi:hypothetical protein